MDKFALLSSFNRMLTDLGEGWVVTGGEIQMYKEAYLSRDEETKQLMRRVFAGFLSELQPTGRLYDHTADGHVLRPVFMEIASFLSDPPKQLSDSRT